MKIKLIVWDLDDTLWAGTLAENEDVVLFEERASIIRKLNGHGIVSAIASKNDYEQAASKLKEFGMWDVAIEEWTLAKVIEKHPKLDTSVVNLQPRKATWLRYENFDSPKVRHYILQQQTSRCDEKIELRIMANCQSGALAHFSKLGPAAEFDNMPRFFILSMVLDGSYKTQTFPNYLVYGPFSDYWDIYWPEALRGDKFVPVFARCAAEFIDYISERKINILILLPPEDAREGQYCGVSRKTIVLLNDVWLGLSKQCDCLSLLKISDIACEGDLIDARHYEVSLLKKMGERIASWFVSRNETHKSTDLDLEGAVGHAMALDV